MSKSSPKDLKVQNFRYLNSITIQPVSKNRGNNPFEKAVNFSSCVKHVIKKKTETV